MNEKISATEEKVLTAAPGMPMLLLTMVLLLGSAPVFVLGSVCFGPVHPWLLALSIVVGVLLIVAGCILPVGLKVIHPNEALVLTLFGNYYGTLYQPGFYWVNPFCTAINPTAEQLHKNKPGMEALFQSGNSKEAVSVSANTVPKKKVSLRTMTLDNKKQKVNDELGNPIEIGTVVIWKVANATKAVLNVENFMEYLSIQCDSITRNAARRFPYDTTDERGEKSLRGSSQEIADMMQEELQRKVLDAGIQIIDVRITHLAYAPEIASAMLQRQQAAAIIDARQKIVEGAVSMVDMALHQLSENDIVELDEERKAAMVSNLLVVLCGNKDAQPIVNSGSIY